MGGLIGIVVPEPSECFGADIEVFDGILCDGGESRDLGAWQLAEESAAGTGLIGVLIGALEDGNDLCFESEPAGPSQVIAEGIGARGQGRVDAWLLASLADLGGVGHPSARFDALPPLAGFCGRGLPPLVGSLRVRIEVFAGKPFEGLDGRECFGAIAIASGIDHGGNDFGGAEGGRCERQLQASDFVGGFGSQPHDEREGGTLAHEAEGVGGIVLQHAGGLFSEAIALGWCNGARVFVKDALDAGGEIGGSQPHEGRAGGIDVLKHGDLHDLAEEHEAYDGFAGQIGAAGGLGDSFSEETHNAGGC